MEKELAKEVSYCALYCGNCFIRFGNIADLAQELLEKFEQVEFEKWAKGLAGMAEELKAFEKYEACYEVLRAWDGMRCGSCCKDGGGASSCRIRACCQSKRIEGCWECGQFEKCETLEWLKPVSGSMNIENMKKINKIGIDGFVKEISSKKYSVFHKS